MTLIDPEVILAELREVGAQLCSTFWQLEPVVELDEMLAAFRRIDGEAQAALRLALARAYPHIGWLEGEFDEVEADVLAARGEYWICDAIDGAVQFVRDSKLGHVADPDARRRACLCRRLRRHA